MGDPFLKKAVLQSMKKNGKVLCFPGVNMDPSAQPQKAKRIKPLIYGLELQLFGG